METNERQMTVRDVLLEVQHQLNELKIPVAEVETIGIVVARAISGIQVCIEAMDRADAEQAEQKEPIQLEIVAEPVNKEEPNA